LAVAQQVDGPDAHFCGSFAEQCPTYGFWPAEGERGRLFFDQAA
jgi:hypothetical protein